ncbi:OmpA family protein [Rhizobium sp. NRK18]|uniref:OmpA family protein n=1 Tax=Rhizobium sp. NRK18 TaxID=2964667 RepID=UPI0021C49BD0|nr:OmpA family protein [Rhizobium sp. NRK18]MCQ2004029.1 OmpA family protein [Rhizobium sp. NRK18]
MPNKKLLLTHVFMPIVGVPLMLSPAAAMPVVKPAVGISQNAVVTVAMSVKEARQAVRRARKDLEDAKANGGDVAGAEAALQQAEAELEAAQTAGGDQNADQGQPQAEPAPAAEPAPDQAEAPRKKRDKKPEMNDQTPAEAAPAPEPAPEAPPAEAPPAPEAAPAPPPPPEPKAEAPKPQPEASAPAPEAAPAPEEKPAMKKKKKPADEQPAEVAPAPEAAPAPAPEPKPAPEIIPQTQDAAPAPDQTQDATPRKDRKRDKTAEGKRRPVLDSAKDGEEPATQQAAPAPDASAPPPPPAPKSDADAQKAGAEQAKPIVIEKATQEEGKRIRRAPDFQEPQGAQVEKRVRGRDVLRLDGRIIVRSDDSSRFGDDRETTYEQLSQGRVREIVTRPNGVQIVTIRNRYGDIIQRSRIDRRGRETVLFYSPELNQRPNEQRVYRDPGLDLPPMRLRIPVDQYIIDSAEDPDRDYYDFLREPPVERVERVYSLDEVRYSARVRDKMRRIDLDTIHFATGSADVSMNQADSLENVAEAMKRIIDKDPGETFLIEGHTDAVGSDESNLVLSDERAESVAEVLSRFYKIPPENLVTQGYGERYLKIQTDGPSQENRRVTIRRITALVRPVASNQ